MAIHRGKIVDEAIVQSGKTKVWVAKKMKKDRSYLYQLLEKPDLDDKYITLIGELIGHDFSKAIPDLLIPANKVEEAAQEYFTKQQEACEEQLKAANAKIIQQQQEIILLLKGELRKVIQQ